MIEPQYASVIVVAVRHQNCWEWYSSDREEWILNKRKWFGWPASSSDSRVSHRALEWAEDVARMSEFAIQFLSGVEPFAATTPELRRLFATHLPVKDWDSVCHLMPSLLVDFDSQQVSSVYAEPYGFLEHLPSGWGGAERGFFEEVPLEMRYWVVDGVDEVAHLLA